MFFKSTAIASQDDPDSFGALWLSDWLSTARIRVVVALVTSCCRALTRKLLAEEVGFEPTDP